VNKLGKVDKNSKENRAGGYISRRLAFLQPGRFIFAIIFQKKEKEGESAA